MGAIRHSAIWLEIDSRGCTTMRQIGDTKPAEVCSNPWCRRTDHLVSARGDWWHPPGEPVAVGADTEAHVAQE